MVGKEEFPLSKEVVADDNQVYSEIVKQSIEQACRSMQQQLEAAILRGCAECGAGLIGKDEEGNPVALGVLVSHEWPVEVASWALSRIPMPSPTCWACAATIGIHKDAR